MKKIIGRIIFVFFILAVTFQHVCYADVIMSSPFEEFTLTVLAILIYGGFFVAIALLVTIIAYVILKIDKAKNKDESKDYKDREKKMKKLMVIFAFYLVFLIPLYFILPFVETEFMLYIYGLLLVSLLLRVFKKKKLSTIILVSTMALILIVPIVDKIIEIKVERYNQQFKQYINNYDDDNHGYLVNDIEGLINTTINNNKRGRKTTIWYLRKEYTSVDELNKLLDILNTDDRYVMNYRYSGDYINLIVLSRININESERKR